jgi:hypothetical protein
MRSSGTMYRAHEVQSHTTCTHTNTKKRIVSAYKKISRTPNQSGHRTPLMPTRTDSILNSFVVPLQWAHSFVPLTSCRHGEKLYDAACSVFVLVSTLEPRGTIFHWKLFDISLLSCDIFRAPWRRRMRDAAADLEAIRWHVCHPNCWFYALEPSFGCMGRVLSNISWEFTPYSSTMVDASKTSHAGGRILRLNWTCRYRWRHSGGTFQRFIGSVSYLYIWGRWKLLRGVEIGPASCVLGWHTMSERSGLGMTRRPNLHVEVLPFVSYVQTRDHDHAVASLYCTSFDFWWVSSDWCKEWVWFRWQGPFWRGLSARLLEGNLAERGWRLDRTLGQPRALSTHQIHCIYIEELIF